MSHQSPSEESADHSDSFLPLLISLIVMLVLAPISMSHPLMASFIGLITLLAGVIAVRHDHLFRATVIGGIATGIPIRLAAQFYGDRWPVLIVLSHMATGIYFAILSVVVLVRIISHQHITSQTVIGAVCGYLLIGYVFTFGFLVLVYFDPAAISIAGQPIGEERVNNIGEHMAELFYFSFISLTTVGYGDIVPANPIARTMVVVEILTRQLYLAAFVARLVGAMSSSPPSGSSK